jgi:hypothetical protein
VHNFATAVPLARVLELFPYEPPFHGGSVQGSGESLSIPLGRSLLGYSGLASIEDYFVRIAGSMRPTILIPEPALVSPFGLIAALDYLSAVWQLHFRGEPPLVRYFNGERTAQLSHRINNRDEFRSQIAALAEILKNLQVKGGDSKDKTALRRLRTRLCARTPEESRATINSAVSVLADIATVRNKLFEHDGSEHFGIEALSRLGVSYTDIDWADAWQQIQRRMIDAVNTLREEIQLASQDK